MKNVEELLKYPGVSDWGIEKSETGSELDLSHAFSPIFEDFRLIKSGMMLSLRGTSLRRGHRGRRQSFNEKLNNI
jgi:hypothetical protein